MRAVACILTPSSSTGGGGGREGVRLMSNASLAMFEGTCVHRFLLQSCSSVGGVIELTLYRFVTALSPGLGNVC